MSNPKSGRAFLKTTGVAGSSAFTGFQPFTASAVPAVAKPVHYSDAGYELLAAPLIKTIKSLLH